eukprot:scaffold7545_cov41-Prasinocladus_malaysianus.AAC.1
MSLYRLPFSMVDNPWFRTFVWFLDPAIVVPNRKTAAKTLLPALLQKTERHVASLLDGVKGVAVAFDDWMKCAGEDVIAANAFFIDKDWKWRVVNLGLIHKRDSASRDGLAEQLKPLLAAHKLDQRIYAFVNDQRANLRTITEALMSDDGPDRTSLACTAMGTSKPHQAECYAQATNNACNAGVAVAKETTFTSFVVSEVFRRFGSCCTYIRNSATGLAIFERCCALANVASTKFQTAVKSRFASVSQVTNPLQQYIASTVASC